MVVEQRYKEYLNLMLSFYGIFTHFYVSHSRLFVAMIL